MKSQSRTTPGPQEYQGQLRLLEVLSGLGRVVSESLDLQQLASRSLRLLVEDLDLDVAWLHGWRDGELHLEGRASTLPQRLERKLDDWRPDPAASQACGIAIQERRPIEASFRPDDELGFQHLRAMPLLAKDRVIGCLSVAKRGAQGFSDEEREFLQSCSSHLGLAVEHARFFEEERRRAHDLSRINELGGLLSQHLDLPALADIAVNHLSKLVDGRDVFLLLLEGNDRLRMVACSLENPAVRDVKVERSDARATFGAIERGQAVIIRDPANDPQPASRIAKQFGHTQLAAIPLVTHQGPVGSIILGETRGREISDSDVKRAVAVGIQVSQAIFNARLFAAERQRLRELKLLSDLGRIAATHAGQQQLLSSCLRLFHENLGFDLSLAFPLGGRELGDGSALRVVSPALEPAIAEAMIGALEDTAAMASRRGGPVRDRASLGDRFVHTCAVPLPAPTGTDAILVFGRIDPPVTDAELQILDAAAPEIGVALENARRFTETKRRVEELRLLLEVGQTLTGSLELEPVLVASAEVVIRLVDACQSFIFLLDETGEELVGVSASRPEWRDAIRQTRLRVDSTSMAAACIRAKRPVQAEDATRSPDAHAALVEHYGHKSIMAVPLLVRNEAIGVMLVGDTEAPRRWTDAEQERVSLIAHQIAAAAANARLYADLRSSYAELARTQESLVKQERLAALGELAAVVAHEIRNPLGAIFNSLASLQRLLRPTGDAGVLLEIVEEEADRLDRIVNDLLDFTKPHVPKLEATQVATLIEETLHALPSGEGQEIACELEAGLPSLCLDFNMVRQALLNLALNAIQSMQGRGKLTIRAERHVEPEAAFVRITVADQGDGIPQEFTERIFQPFFTTKATGTGLGLAVVKRVMDAHRGRIHVASEAKRGTTFTLFFPIEEASR